jgi:hypothetical protein
MNSHIMSENPVFIVVSLRNSRAIRGPVKFSGRLDEELFSHNLLRSALINTSLVEWS